MFLKGYRFFGGAISFYRVLLYKFVGKYTLRPMDPSWRHGFWTDPPHKRSLYHWKTDSVRRALGVVKSVVQFRQMSGLLIFGDSKKVFLLETKMYWITGKENLVMTQKQKPCSEYFFEMGWNGLRLHSLLYSLSRCTGGGLLVSWYHGDHEHLGATETGVTLQTALFRQ